MQSGALKYSGSNYDILKIVADNIDSSIELINRRWKRYERILSFKYEDKFIVYENDSLLFTIDRNQLKLDSKMIYEK